MHNAISLRSLLSDLNCWEKLRFHNASKTFNVASETFNLVFFFLKVLSFSLEFILINQEAVMYIPYIYTQYLTEVSTP